MTHINGYPSGEKLAPFREETNRDGSNNIGRFRHVIAVLALSGILLANMNRQAYNQALVRMIRTPSPVSEAITSPAPPVVDLTTKSSNISLKLESIQVDQVKNKSDINIRLISKRGLDASAADDDDDRYAWTGSQISLLQAAFSYGYMPLMIAGGRLSEIYGAKWVIFISGFGSALCSLLTPYLADYSFVLLLVARILIGVCQTGISPALFSLLTRWLPADESSVYLAMIKVGVMFGFMFGSLINGFIPWRLMFYIVAIIGFAWSLMWAICVTSNPGEHKFLSKKELKYIEERLMEQAKELEQAKITNSTNLDKTNHASHTSSSAPWLNILTNPVVIAFALTKFTVKLSTDTQSIQVPMYLKSVFQVSDQVNGTLNGINFAIQALFTGAIAYLAKEMIRKKTFGLTKTKVRKLFQGLSNFGTSLAYIMISFNFGSLNIVCSAIILLSVSSMFGAGGEAVLPVDLTLEYSASIMAIANSTANLSGIVLPSIVSFILDNELTSHIKWNLVWWFIGAFMASGGLVFCLFVEAKLQDFHHHRHRNDDNDNNDETSTTTTTTTTSKNKQQAITENVIYHIEMKSISPVSLTKFKQIKD